MSNDVSGGRANVSFPSFPAVKTATSAAAAVFHLRPFARGCCRPSARRAERQVFTRIEEQLPPSFLGEIDALLDVPESERRSSLFRLKEYPPEGKPETILAFLDNYTLLQSIGVSSIRIVGCSWRFSFSRCSSRSCWLCGGRGACIGTSRIKHPQENVQLFLTAIHGNDSVPWGLLHNIIASRC